MGKTDPVTRAYRTVEVTVRRPPDLEGLCQTLFAKPSGLYLVTVHNRCVTKVAEVARPVHLEEAPSKTDEGKPVEEAGPPVEEPEEEGPKKKSSVHKKNDA